MTLITIKVFQSCLGEMFASFIFGFTVYTAVIASAQTLQVDSVIIVSLSIFLSATAIIYSFCDITVAHFNPALTFTSIITRRIRFLYGVLYIIAQVVGFILAGFASIAVLPGNYKDKLDIARPKRLNSDVSKGTVFAAEFFLTAIFVFIAFSVGINPYIPPKDEEGAQIDPNEQLVESRKITAPLAIGFALGFLALLGLGSSGGAFNPGIVLGPMILTGIWDMWYIYLLAEFSGGLIGGLLQVCILTKIF